MIRVSSTFASASTSHVCVHVRVQNVLNRNSLALVILWMNALAFFIAIATAVPQRLSTQCPPDSMSVIVSVQLAAPTREHLQHEVPRGANPEYDLARLCLRPTSM